MGMFVALPVEYNAVSREVGMYIYFQNSFLMFLRSTPTSVNL